MGILINTMLAASRIYLEAQIYLKVENYLCKPSGQCKLKALSSNDYGASSWKALLYK